MSFVHPTAAVLALASSALLAGCGGEPAVDRGRALFQDPAFSSAPSNLFACATCHSTVPGGEPARHFSGYTLADSVARPSFWGGGIRTLRDAASYCRVEFMRGPPIDADDPDGRALLVYLESISPAAAPPALPLTVVKDIPLSLPRGDTARGSAVFDGGCAPCHGAARTAAGRLAEWIPRIPDASIAEHGLDPMTGAYRTTIAKVRNGKFYNIGGVMPLYSIEALSDGDLADLLAHLALDPPASP